MNDEKQFKTVKRNYTLTTLKWRYEKKIEDFQKRLQNRIIQNDLNRHYNENFELKGYGIKKNIN